MVKKKSVKPKTRSKNKNTPSFREMSDRSMRQCKFYTTISNFVIVATIVLLLIIVISAVAIGGAGTTTSEPTPTQENLGIAIWITTGVLLFIAFVVYIYAYYQKTLFCVKLNLNIESDKISTSRFYNARGGGNAIVPTDQ